MKLGRWAGLIKLGRWAGLMFVAGAYVWMLVYTYRNYSIWDYRIAYLSSFAATIFGLIVGIPAGLEIDRLQGDYADDVAKGKEETKASERRDRVLKLIANELDFNVIAIKGRNRKFDPYTKRIDTPRLKLDLWEAFSDGGELEWVKDPDLLDLIATAYYHVRGVALMELSQ